MTITLGGWSTGRKGSAVRCTADNAYENMRQLLIDIGLDDATFKRDIDADDGKDGRFEFLVTRDGVVSRVTMPGVPLANARVVDPKEQNHLDFACLWIDGSHYYWCWAVPVLRSALLQEDDDGWIWRPASPQGAR